MTTQPKISIIIPAYNVENYIQSCINSILNQSYKNFEIILIDDGSTDKTFEICDKYAQKDQRVRIMRQKNAGAPTALNKGLKEANGKYIWFIDSDDFIEENALEILVNKAEESNADIILFGARSVDYKEGAPTNIQNDYWNLSSVDKKYTQELFNYKNSISWLINLPTVPWNKFHKKDFIIKHKIKFDTELLAPYDAFFNLCCYLKNANIIFLDKILYNYRLTTSSTTAKLVSDKSAKWNQPILLPEKTDKLIKEENVPTDLYPAFVKRTFVHTLYWFRRAEGSSRKKFYKQLQKYFKNLDCTIYTKENLKMSGYYNQYKEIRDTPYIIYNLKEKLHKLQIIKNKKTKNKKIRKFLGIEIKKTITNKEQKTTYILGIPLYKKKIKTNEQKKIDLIYQELIKLDNKMNNLKVIIEATTKHQYLAKYKNIYKDKEIVIVATGPSAQYYIPKPNCIHIGINGATRLNKIKLDYLFVQDYALENKMNEDADAYNCIKFYGHHADVRAKKLYPKVKRLPMSSRLNTSANTYLLEEISYNNFAYDIANEPFGDFQSTVFSALQFALYTHPKKIYLVGCDCSQGYFYKSPVPFSHSDNVKKGWMLFKKFKDEIYPDVEIISINPVGLKGLFAEENTIK